MKHFKVLQYHDIDELAAAIEVAINDGWDLVGQMFVAPPTMMAMASYNQAITKTSRGEYKGWMDCIKPKCNEPTEEESVYCKEHRIDLGGEELPIG